MPQRGRCQHGPSGSTTAGLAGRSVKMKILLVHNYYQQPGGEDQCLAAELAMLEANGHEVIPYYVHNDSIEGMNRLELAARTVWSRPAYHEMRGLIQTHRPQIAHFHNTFPLIS